MKSIGILGGMGPRATVYFEQKLLNKFEGFDQQIPTLLCVNDGSIPDRSRFLIDGGKDPSNKLTRNAMALQDIGADFICIPCNTAHARGILDKIQAAIDIPIINMPELVVERLKGVRTKVTLLATRGTLAGDVYQTKLEQAGIKNVRITEEQQCIVDEIITSTKKGDIIKAKNLAVNLSYELPGYIILGCTELSIAFEDVCSTRKNIIDSLEILAESCAIIVKEEVYASR